eukprot:TRINITY_DN5721_c0_g1_i4.p1 TRINITY_DN5721_c0_g1~~TRINITY_DN5721_c0_g1_i4.p1  ORF type:complete len:670 (+),score=102.30 TRINITY_DN5721_c0_g1_i4:51-2060(+)
MPHNAALPLRRVYFGIIFTLDLLINLLLYVTFAAVVDEGWTSFWRREVSEYEFNSSSFDIMILGTSRSLLLLYLYSYRDSTRSTIPLVSIFCISVIWVIYKMAYFDGNHGLDITLMIFSLLAAIIEVLIVYARLRAEKRAKKYNRFLGAVESSAFAINPSTLSGYYTFQSHRNSIVGGALHMKGPDIREVPNSLSKKLEWSARIGEHLHSELTREVQDYSNWKILQEYNDAFVYYKEDTKNSVICLKSMAVIPASPQELQSILSDHLIQNRWDPLCADCVRVEEIGPGTEILHVILPNMGPLASRDLCCLRRLCPRIDEGFSIVMSTVFHQDRPETLSHIRAELGISGFQVRPHKTKEGSSLVIYLLVIDVKGWIPDRVAQLISELHPQTLINLKNMTCKKESTSPQMLVLAPPPGMSTPDSQQKKHPTSLLAQNQRISTLRQSIGKREKRRTIDDLSSEQNSDHTSRFSVRSSIASHLDNIADESRSQPNILPRIRTQMTTSEQIIKDYDEFLSRWEDMYKTAVDLHLEDRVTEAYAIIQIIFRSLEEHLAFVRERVTEDTYWKREGELGKVLYFMSQNRQIDAIKSDATEVDAWITELQNKSGWTPLPMADGVSVWKRYDRGRALPTVKFEAIVDAPLTDCLAILNEIDQMKSWIPQVGHHGVSVML